MAAPQAGNPVAQPYAVALAAALAPIVTQLNTLTAAANGFFVNNDAAFDAVNTRLGTVERVLRRTEANVVTAENYIETTKTFATAMKDLAKAAVQNAPKKTAAQMHWFSKLAYGNLCDIPDDLGNLKLGAAALSYFSTIGTWLAVPYVSGKALQTAADSAGLHETQVGWTQWACLETGFVGRGLCNPYDTFAKMNVRTFEIFGSAFAKVVETIVAQEGQEVKKRVSSYFENSLPAPVVSLYKNAYSLFSSDSPEQQSPPTPAENTFFNEDFKAPTAAPADTSYFGAKFTAPAPAPTAVPFTAPIPAPAGNAFFNDDFATPLPGLGAQTHTPPKSDWKPLAFLIGSVALASIVTSQLIRYLNKIQAVDNPNADTIKDDQLK